MAFFRPFIALFRLCLVSVMLATGQIWTHKARSILTTVGISIGIASVAAVIAFLTGMQKHVVDVFESALGSNRIMLYPHQPRGTERKPLKGSDFEGLLERCPSVRCVCREHRSRSRLESADEELENAEVMGIDSRWHELNKRFASLGRNLTELDSDRQRLVCVIDEGLRNKLKLDIDCINDTIRLNGRPFTIVGVIPKKTETNIFNSTGGESFMVYVPIGVVLDDSFASNRGWLMANAIAKRTDLVDDAQAEMRFFLRGKRGLKPGEPDNFRIEVLAHHMEEFNKIAAVIVAIAGGIVGISLLVGGVGVMNVMLASVSERTREIGLRKAVGARPFAILMQFLIESVVLCFTGGLVGLLAGKGLTVLMEAGMAAAVPHAKLAFSIPLWAVGLSLGFTSLVGIVFGMFPALKAARMDPIKALRHE